MTVGTGIGQLFLTFFYLMVLYFCVMAVLRLGSAVVTFWRQLQERKRGWQQDLEMILHSRHTIPISTVVYGSGTWQQLHKSLSCLSDQKYPEFESIVVLEDGSPLLQPLIAAYELAPKNHVFSRIVPTKEAVSFYGSEKWSTLKVVVKKPSTEWDALNLGINIARYRFVLPVAIGCNLVNDALLRFIQPALADPGCTPAVCGPLNMSADRIQWATLMQLPHLMRCRLRTLFGRTEEQIFSTSGNECLALAPLILWRRDLLLGLGGFNRGGITELSLRMAEYFRSRGEQYRIVQLPQAVGTKEPSSLDEIKERRTSHYEEIRFIWRRYHEKLFARRSGQLGFWQIPRLFFDWQVSKWVDIAALVVLTVGGLYGVIGWKPLLIFILLVATLQLTTTLMGLLLASYVDEELSDKTFQQALLGAILDASLFYWVNRGLSLAYGLRQDPTSDARVSA